jgi:PAS domain-containing protein
VAEIATNDRDQLVTTRASLGRMILERPREDLVGKNLWEELPTAVGSLFDAELRRVLGEQVPARFEEDYEPIGRTLEVRAYPVSEGLAVYYTDVTNERLRDARLRQPERLLTMNGALIEPSPSAVVVLVDGKRGVSVGHPSLLHSISGCVSRRHRARRHRAREWGRRAEDEAGMRHA